MYRTNSTVSLSEHFSSEMLSLLQGRPILLKRRVGIKGGSTSVGWKNLSTALVDIGKVPKVFEANYIMFFVDIFTLLLYNPSLLYLPQG